MAFELAESTAVTITNANPRRELHGEEKVRAIDISFTLTGENTLLDLLEPGLREHHYCNKAATAGQEALPGVLIPLPNLRHPQLPLLYHYGKGQKWRGYRFIWDWGIEDAHVDFMDAVLTGLHYELSEGGSVTIKGTIQYNGDELQDNDVFGELSGLAAEGEIYIKLLAPAELLQAKKGYRAGKPDTPASQPDNEDQQELDVDGEDEPPTDPNHPVNQTPEDAFAAAVTGDQA
ncbi:hypothetical protein [Delftia acidovorans]|uniref:hypothetical protein n=1 Tax=Delftia acidovorans TaxID=80866 RepID=UPI0028A862AC|nr:hypothetical protein [Delftia acidovorans]